MSFQTNLALLLVVHVIGLTMMAGGFLSVVALNGRVYRYIQSDKNRALALIDGTSGLFRIISLGALLLIFSGTWMTILLKGAVTQALWFKVKMPLVVLLIVNIRLIGLPASKKISKSLANKEVFDLSQIDQWSKRLRLSYWTQLLLLLLIFIVSIFKFS
jgi:small-conductance mechanosensitive channel